MIMNALFDTLKNTLADKISSGDFIHQSKEEIQSSVRILLESGLRTMDLVSREEFDAQCLVLARTREQLNELEQKLDALNSEL